MQIGSARGNRRGASALRCPARSHAFDGANLRAKADIGGMFGAL
jgi:hypothetical protein